MPRAALLVVLVLVAGCATPAEEGPRPNVLDIHGLAFDVADSAKLYVATHHGLFLRNGTAWSHVTQRPFDMMGFTVHPTDPAVMYASGHDPPAAPNVGVRRSEDAGRTWTTISLEGQVDFHALAASRADASRLWGYHSGRLCLSDNGGHNWACSRFPGLPQLLSIATDATSVDTLFGASTSGVARSDDGGGSWRDLDQGSDAATAIGASADGLRLAAFHPAHGLRTSENGTAWVATGLSLAPEEGVGAITFDSHDRDHFAVGTYRAAIHETRDGGATWTRILAPVP